MSIRETSPQPFYHFPESDRLRHPQGLQGYREADTKMFKTKHTIDGPISRVSVELTNAAMTVMERDLIMPLRRLQFSEQLRANGRIDDSTAAEVDAIMQRIFQQSHQRNVGQPAQKFDSKTIGKTEFDEMWKRVVNLACSFYERDFTSLGLYVMQKHQLSKPQAAKALLMNDGCLAKAIALETAGLFIEDTLTYVRQHMPAQ
jgi:hypothetical protein